MNYAELLQVVAVVCVLTAALVLLAGELRRTLREWIERCLPPRHLRARGVRRRQAGTAENRDARE